MANSCKPGRPTVARIWLVVGGENSAYNILVDVQIKGQVNLLSDAWTAEPWIALLHLDDGINDFSGWSSWAWFEPAAK
jgi:hypothetical protein